MIDGQVQDHQTVAAHSVGGVISGRIRTFEEDSAMPDSRVASDKFFKLLSAVGNGQMQDNQTIAAHGIGSVIGGRIGAFVEHSSVPQDGVTSGEFINILCAVVYC